MKDEGIEAGEAVRRFSAEIDRRLVRGLAVFRAQGHKVSCTDCTNTACCLQPVFVHLAGALPIAEVLHESETDTPNYRARLLREGIAMERASRDDWFDDEHLCVLHDGKRCTQYDLRPVACRAYFVTTPSATCSPPSGAEVSALDFNDLIDRGSYVYQSIHRDLGLRENEFRLMCCSLPRAIWIWLEVLDRAKAGKPWHKFVNHQPWPNERTIREWVADEHDLIRQPETEASCTATSKSSTT